MDVVRDVLDKPVADRNGREMGRVDGILLEPRGNQPPRLTAILIGPAALGDRVHPRLGQWIRKLERRFGLPADRPAQIAFDAIDDVDPQMKVRLTIAVGETPVEAVEQRLRAWISRLPGGR